MPEQHRAESTIVRPDPVTGPAIDEIIDKLAFSATMVAMSGENPGTIFVSGLIGGLTLAIDHPEAVPLVLAHLDYRSIEEPTEPGEPTHEFAVEKRAEAMDDLANAALNGKSPTQSNWLN